MKKGKEKEKAAFCYFFISQYIYSIKRLHCQFFSHCHTVPKMLHVTFVCHFHYFSNKIKKNSVIIFKEDLF